MRIGWNIVSLNNLSANRFATFLARGFIFCTFLAWQCVPSVALEQILANCKGGYRASHSELNENLNFRNDNNYQMNPAVKIWNGAALHQDTETNNFYVQYSSAGSYFYRPKNTDDFRVWRGSDKSVIISFVARQTTRSAVIHNFNFYINTFGQGRLLHGWQVIRPRDNSTGPASGIDTYSCDMKKAFLTEIKKEKNL